MNTAPKSSSDFDSGPFRRAIHRFDEENAKDPNQEMVDGVQHPREWIYARRLTEWVLALCPAASEELRLAARCQHICRWQIPRDQFGMDRAGYHRWRTALKTFHADKSAEILREVGYGNRVIDRVRSLNLKENFPTDPESQILEDALCLVFIQFQFEELSSKTTQEKLLNAVSKIWRKMSPDARGRALKLPLGALQKELILKAVGTA